MTPHSSPTLPGPAVAAALLGLVSATSPVLAVLLVVVAAGDVDAASALSPLPPLGMSAELAGGAVLLLSGRSWPGLALPAAVLAAAPGVRHRVAEPGRLRAVLPTVPAS